MSNIYTNELNEILNSTVINRNIDCTIPCNILLYFMCCCPTQVINYFPPGSKDFKEMFMILLSLTPYPTVFLLMCLAAYFRTSRSVLILAMVFLENFTVIALKNFIREPRPNYLCNQEFGYPSNHACFFTCILFWFISEEMCTPEHLQFEHKTYLIPFGLIYPFIVYSRYYLNYHSFGQIFGGIFLGIFIGVGWYLLNVKYILCTDNILRQLMIYFTIENNLTNDLLYQDDGYVLLDEYQALIQKENELRNMKQKLRSVNKNMKKMKDIEGLNENFQDIINDNNYDENAANEDINEFGEESSETNINEINNNIGDISDSLNKLKKD